MVVVNVKWGKQKFEGVEVDVGEPVAVFKAQLFALTNVPPERQKVMASRAGSSRTTPISPRSDSSRTRT